MSKVTVENFGEPAEALVFSANGSQATLHPRQVRIRMLAAPINPSDLMAIRGEYSKILDLPAVPGFEGVGRVVESGGGLFGRWLQGKLVSVLPPSAGTWQSKLVVPTTSVIPLPSEMNIDQAATFFVNPASAWLLLTQVTKPPAGAAIVLSAAASALGKMLLRLAKFRGLRTIAVVRRAEQEGLLRELGADATVVYNGDPYQEQAALHCIQVAAAGLPIRFGYDPVGGSTAGLLVKSLSNGGKLVCYGTLSGQPLDVSPRELMTTGKQIEGFWLADRMAQMSLFSKILLIRRLSGLVAGPLKTEVSAVYRLADIKEAVAAAETPGKPGKVLLTMDETRLPASE
jgi:NADPH:quinone reductase